MIRVLNVRPLMDVDGVSFGMKREEVRKIFGEAKTFKKNNYSKTLTDDFGFCHVFYNTSDECEAIEIFNDVKVQMDGKIVFPDDKELLLQLISDAEVDDVGFISKKLSIGVYAPDGKMESILFGCKGYYD